MEVKAVVERAEEGLRLQYQHEGSSISHRAIVDHAYAESCVARHRPVHRVLRELHAIDLIKRIRCHRSVAPGTIFDKIERCGP